MRWVGLLEAARRGELCRRMRQSRALPDAVSLEARHTREHPPMSDGTAARLREYFEPHDRRLEALLGRAMGW